MRIVESKKAHQKLFSVLLYTSLFFIFNIGSSQAARPIRPPIPTNLSITYSSGTYFISWTGDASTSTAYELKWQRLENGHWKWVSHGTPVDQGNTSSFVLSGISIIDVYRFSIRAVNGNSKSSWTAWLEVGGADQNNLPVANAGPDISTIVGHLLTLDGTGSTDADGDSLNYSWQVSLRPLNSLATITAASSSTPDFTPDLAGQYQIDLVVNDGKVDSIPDQLIINTVANSIPVANAGSDQTVAPGQTVALDGSQSFDQDGDTLTYNWSMLEKPAASLASLTDPGISSPTFTADLSGRYITQLIVNDGFADSVPVTVTTSVTSLNLIVLSPPDSSTTSNSYITVTGTVEGVDPSNKNIGVVIDNQLAAIDRSVTPIKYAARVPLLPGEQAITVIATTQMGESASKTLTITRNAGSGYDVDIKPTSGVSPLAVELSLSLNDPYNNVFVKLAVDFDDDGYDDFTYDGIEYTPEGNIIVHPLDLSQKISFTYTDPGIYQAKVRALDFVSLNNQGTTLTDHIVPVEVISETLDESLYTAIWNGMNAAVVAGDIALAETAFTRGSRKKFTPLLTALQPHFQEIMDSYTDWQVVTNFPGYKEFVLNRTVNGENQIYFVTFIQDHAGVWRITSM
ncbi:MAG: PKD domain-containing protein [Pseudomonadota bacterium]|nr:PKD domain-containing protein [Pseudomonadota bacterium]